jgi:hypothetical protein
MQASEGTKQLTNKITYRTIACRWHKVRLKAWHATFLGNNCYILVKHGDIMIN